MSLTQRGVLLCGLVIFSSFVSASQCNDGIDNNANGLIDLLDPYCKSADDNDESSFRGGAGDDLNAPRSLDCFFDTNSGAGDDGCVVHACCMIDGPCPADLDPASFDPNACGVSAACQNNCLPQTQPDCDCFGCCTLCDPQSGNCATAFVNPVVSPSCTLEQLTDPLACRACTPNPSCRVFPSAVFRNGFE